MGHVLDGRWPPMPVKNPPSGSTYEFLTDGVSAECVQVVLVIVNRTLVLAGEPQGVGELILELWQRPVRKAGLIEFDWRGSSGLERLDVT